MATLQKIRSKGPLLVIVIGVALFAFIAGDAWRVFQPHQSQDVGEVNGDAISAQDYQKLLEEYTEVLKLSNGLNSLTDEQNNQVKDEVWRSYVNGKLVEDEAEKLGLTVSDEEIKAIINQGTHPILRNTPFANPQTGMFDRDVLMKFLADYAKMSKSQLPAQYMEYYQTMYNFWTFLEKTLRQTRLQEKYQALIAQALLTNPVEVQNSFDGRTKQTDMMLAAIPYSSIPDSTIQVSDEELQAAYDKKKERYRQYAESRSIRYIDVQVTASDADKAALQKEMDEYTVQLADTKGDYASFIRSTGSTYPYTDLYYTTRALPADVVARLDSVATGDVFGPYYNAMDNTLNSFKKLSVASMPDSVQFRMIQVVAETPDKTKTLADSIYNAIKGGADFTALAQKYGQTGEANWISSTNYEGAQLEGDNLKYLQTVTSLKPKELTNLALAQANVILEVTDRKATKEKYKVAVIKRPIEFSKETYNKAYNDFSQFIADNNTLDKLVDNAEEAGYRLLSNTDLYSSEHGIGGIADTKEALRWAFQAEVGDVSGLYECGENDHLMVVGLAGIMPEGYRPLVLAKNELRREIIREKKGDKIIADMKAANLTTFDQYKGMENAVSDSVKHVTFGAQAYVSALRSSEPVVSAYASAGKANTLSAPLKGTAGVMVLQPYAEEKLNETFDQKAEQQRVESMYASIARQFLNDLYLKANVKDKRYLFF